MRKDVAVLLGLLVASNAAWATFTFVCRHESSAPSDTAPPLPTGEVSRPPGAQEPTARTAHEPELAAAPARAPAAVEEARSATSVTPKPSTASAPPPARSANAPTRVDPAAAAAARAPSAEFASWTVDVLQIEDPARRERGLVAIGVALQSSDPPTATAALKSLYGLRDVAYDKSRFRDAVLARLEDPDAEVRRAAAFALLNVTHQPGDVDLLIESALRHPDDLTRTLIVGAWLSKNRVEGRLADVYVKALSVEDSREAVSAANSLRGMWVTGEVEDAVLAVWRRTQDSAGWNHILGQIAPTRQARLDVIFEILREDRTDAPQLLNRALEAQNLDPAAKPIAVRKALEALPTAPNSMIGKLLIDVVHRNGTVTDVPALRTFAANTMVGQDLRDAASAAADAIAARR